MKRRCFFITVVLAIFLISTCSVSFAGTGDQCTKVTGSTAATKTFKIKVTPKTYGSDAITLKHSSKGRLVYTYRIGKYWSGNYKTKNSYGYYTVQIKDEKGSTIRTMQWKNSQKLRIPLSTWFKYKGEHFTKKTYTVVVKPYSKSQITKELKSWQKFIKWDNHSKWKVYKTRGVDSCS